MDILKLLIELVGTFLFVFIILNVTKTMPPREPLLAASTMCIVLLAMFLVAGAVAKDVGYFNPVVTLAKFMDGTVNMTHLSGFVIAQVIGAILAFKVWETTK